MMGLLLANLALILFDLLFSSQMVQQLLLQHVPVFHDYYLRNIHRDFFAIDIWFVGIFILELFIRWGLAIKNRTYYKWFFYPFIHWYDVLGCIPVGSFRFLRVLRIISIGMRLQRLKIIDITKTYLYAIFNKYLNILTEEVSDRVVLNVLGGIQDQVSKGNPLVDQIMTQVIEPQKPAIVEWLSHRLQFIVSEAYGNYREDLQSYVELRIQTAVEHNKEIKNISRIPVIGTTLAKNLQKAINDIVYNVIDQSIKDLGSPGNKVIIDDIAHLSLDALAMEEEDRQLDQVARNIVLQSLELIKDQVKVQQWKVKEEQLKESQLQNTVNNVEHG